MKYSISIIGLGYVGLPLAVEFAKHFPVVGFDLNTKRISELRLGVDNTREVPSSLLKHVQRCQNVSDLKPEYVLADEDLNDTLSASDIGLFCSADVNDIAKSNVYIITVPTPVDRYNRPDLTPLYKASETVGTVLKIGDIVVYESTVYPGVTEEECVPILERVSGLKYNEDFFCGYSPERINPGDKTHTVTKIRKVTSGSNEEIAEEVDSLYRTIITAGSYKATSIKVAEAAKVIENAQRDINIAFVNELAKIFNRMNIDTHDVLTAAATKWNFLPFKPGLVGGHCIGVDPYYLAQKAQEVGYHPEIILAGRRLNDGMGSYIAHEVIKLMIRQNIPVKKAKVLLLGVTFKENCPDVRNTKVIDIFSELQSFHLDITVFDPWANSHEVAHEYGILMVDSLPADIKYDVIILAVSHHEFLEVNWSSYLSESGLIYDVKGCLEKSQVSARL